jgi:hypothetical protein
MKKSLSVLMKMALFKVRAYSREQGQEQGRTIKIDDKNL